MYPVHLVDRISVNVGEMNVLSGSCLIKAFFLVKRQKDTYD